MYAAQVIKGLGISNCTRVELPVRLRKVAGCGQALGDVFLYQYIRSCRCRQSLAAKRTLPVNAHKVGEVCEWRLLVGWFGPDLTLKCELIHHLKDEIRLVFG